MSRLIASSDERVKEFAKILNDVSHGRRIDEIWSDWVTMLAISINASVEKDNEDRQNLYKSICIKYSKDELMKLAKATARYMELVDEFPYDDLLGDMYMRLEMGSAVTGQFFTPYHLAQLTAKLGIDTAIEAIERDGWASLNDPACGGGALLVAGAEELYRRGINYQQCCIFVGNELNMTTAMSAYVQLSMLGCPGYIVIGDTLRAPSTGNVLYGEQGERVWYTPMWFDDTWKLRRLCGFFEKMIGREVQLHPTESSPVEPQKEQAQEDTGQISIFEVLNEL